MWFADQGRYLQNLISALRRTFGTIVHVYLSCILIMTYTYGHYVFKSLTNVLELKVNKLFIRWFLMNSVKSLRQSKVQPWCVTSLSESREVIQYTLILAVSSATVQAQRIGRGGSYPWTNSDPASVSAKQLQ